MLLLSPSPPSPPPLVSLSILCAELARLDYPSGFQDAPWTYVPAAAARRSLSLRRLEQFGTSTGCPAAARPPHLGDGLLFSSLLLFTNLKTLFVENVIFFVKSFTVFIFCVLMLMSVICVFRFLYYDWCWTRVVGITSTVDMVEKSTPPTIKVTNSSSCKFWWPSEQDVA